MVHEYRYTCPDEKRQPHTFKYLPTYYNFPLYTKPLQITKFLSSHSCKCVSTLAIVTYDKLKKPIVKLLTLVYACKQEFIKMWPNYFKTNDAPVFICSFTCPCMV